MTVTNNCSRSDHTNPFSTLNTDVRPELREFTVIQIPFGHTRLEAQLLTPMTSIAHERQFATAQLGHSNDLFENQHTAAIKQFIDDQDRVLSRLSHEFQEMRHLLCFSAPMGTEVVPPLCNEPLVIDTTPPPSPVISIKSEPLCLRQECGPSLSAPVAALRHDPNNKPDDSISVDSSISDHDPLNLEEALRKALPNRGSFRGSRVNAPKVIRRPGLTGTKSESRSMTKVAGDKGKRCRKDAVDHSVKIEAVNMVDEDGESSDRRKRVRFDFDIDEGVEDMEEGDLGIDGKGG
jgi:hypothetical protein